MTNEKLIEYTNKLLHRPTKDPEAYSSNIMKEKFFIQSLQFVRSYIGDQTEFYHILSTAKNESNETKRYFKAVEVLTAVRDFLNDGLEIDTSNKFQTQNDLVSDFLLQAERLLNNKNIHPAAPAILIGATLEEFLRVVISKYDFTEIEKGSIDKYAQLLKKEEKIDKQDFKDITVWAGLRNAASHGHFSEVDDRKRISLALEGVNLFMRKMNLRISNDM
ncbi:hypothetical protein [Portibacter marinus]|uniref:hypothetical protein n=1 Tax=Portibacter marinus TaxID=2898660 RepID=UPI001F427499|nr:hypothetical protein [Portibacter marinus]